MVLSPSRRTLLRTTGLALTAGLAGCELRHRSDDTSGDGSGDGAAGDGPGDDGSRSNGNGASGDGAQSTVEPGSSYDIVVENRISEDDLAPVEELGSDTPATLTVDVDANYSDRDDQVLFEETLDLPPGDSRSFQDAFETDPDGPEYVVGAKLQPFRESDTGPGSSMSLTAAHRFNPAGFQAPTSPTFYVFVMDGEEGDDFGPWILVRDQEPEQE
jgi:hypothetical protein